VDTVLPSLADDYLLEDPHFGRIPKAISGAAPKTSRSCVSAKS
jgi:hypothetical protein